MCYLMIFNFFYPIYCVDVLNFVRLSQPLLCSTEFSINYEQRALFPQSAVFTRVVVYTCLWNSVTHSAMSANFDELR